MLRLQSPKDLGLNDFAKERYTSHDYHDKEVKNLWMKVWQFAAREEEIPEPGDHIRYDIAGVSFLIVRQENREIKAYPNACLHRGRMLKEFDGHASEIRCAFHGFAWTLDGCLKDVPARWDFPQIKDEEFSLPEIPVATWAGFIFINPDQDCEPFEPFIKELADQFERWDSGRTLCPGACRQDHALQLEDRAGSVLRGVSRQWYPPSDYAKPWRCEQSGGCLGKLCKGDHARWHTQPVAGLRVVR